MDEFRTACSTTIRSITTSQTVSELATAIHDALGVCVCVCVCACGTFDWPLIPQHRAPPF
jgi:hypothetical protein